MQPLIMTLVIRRSGKCAKDYGFTEFHAKSAHAHAMYTRPCVDGPGYEAIMIACTGCRCALFRVSPVATCHCCGIRPLSKNLVNLNTRSHCVDIVETEAGASPLLLVQVQM